MTIVLSRTDARRIAVRAQLLAAPRPTGLLDVIRQLAGVQADLTKAVAQNADLVAHSRLGRGYRPADLDSLIDRGQVIELYGMLIDAQDVALYTDEMRYWPGRGDRSEWQDYQGEWVAANDGARRDVLDVLQADGPLPTSELPDTCVLAWKSSGWTDDKNLRRLLGFMVRRGEIAVAGRDGPNPLWDLAERVYPPHEAIPAATAERIRSERRLAALGIDRATGATNPEIPFDLRDIGCSARIEGVRGTWRVDPAYLEGSFRPRTVLLSPLDRLIFDRKRMQLLFEFDYQLEMYKPKAKRRWGYFALPILAGDRLVGKVDATSDHAAGVLRVNAVHEDEPFSRTLAEAVDREIRSLAHLLSYDVQWG